MGKYSYLVLSSDEFELFCKDILEARLNIKLENFKTGKDGGIDLRYAPSDDSSIIVQCKRYKDFKSLEGTIKNEIKKVRKLNPNRYILMTSVPLNPNEKDIIISHFEGYIKSTGDILGKDELDTILESQHAIERKHYKLWLASTNIISTILHNDVYNRSKFTETIIKEKISLYVTNESYYESLNHLEKYKVLILSGGPGIGKTTLADMLYINYASIGYEFIEISKDIDEGEKLFDPEKKQLFYYDDFLGKNFLTHKLSKNEDKRIIHFIKKIRKSENKIFIMTTREYILNQAQINHELFEDRAIEFNKLVIDIEKYTNNVKAKILYNHMYFSDLPEDFVEYFVKNRVYLKIISHRNYTPRLISKMTYELDYIGISNEEYSDLFIRELDYPYTTWRHVFESQITDYSRWILLLLMVMGDKDVKLNDLEDNFNSLNIYLGRPFNNVTFLLGLKELEKTFIKLEMNHSNEDIVSFLNPSVVDFLIQYNNNKRELLRDIWKTSLYFFPLFEIFTISNTKGKILIPFDLRDTYFNTLLDRFDEFKDLQNTGQKLDAISRLSNYIDFNHGKGKEILLNTFSNNAVAHSDKFTYLLIKYKSLLLTSLDLRGIFTFFVDNLSLYHECLDLIELLKYFPEQLEPILDDYEKGRIINEITYDIQENLYEDYEEFDDIIFNLKEIGNILNFGIGEAIEKIETKYIEITEELNSEPDYDESYWRDNRDEGEVEPDYIEDLFESLLYK